MKFQSHLGIDIGTQHVRLVQLALSGAKFRVVALGQVDLPKVAEAAQPDAARTEAIKKLVKETGASSRQVAVSLPEAQVYTRIVEMPRLSEEDLGQAVRWQAEQYLPVPLSEVVLKHQVISAEDKMKVLLVAAPIKLLNSYTTLLGNAGLETVAAETEVLAISRSVVGAQTDAPATMLVHLGAEATTIGVIENGELVLVQAVSSGGDALSRTISGALGLEIAQAEEYKKAYGLDETKLEGKIVGAIRPAVDLLLAEVKRTLSYAQTHGVSGAIKRVVLTGGTAKLSGLVSYFALNLDLEVQLADPFAQGLLSPRQKQDLGDDSPTYATAVGLAEKLT